MQRFHANYLNGRSTAGKCVWVEFAPTNLHFYESATGDKLVQSWNINQLHRNDFNEADFVLLKYGDLPHEYLEVKDPEFAHALKEAYPDSVFSGSRYGALVSGNPKIVTALAAGLLALIAFSYFLVLPKIAEFAAISLPQAAEMKLGQSLANQILEGEKVDSVKTIYAQRFFNNLNGKNVNVKVTVLESPETNAFAMPGGHIVVFKPIITMSKSYEEFAGLLAHENAHLVHRHSLRALFRNLSGYLFMSVLFSDVNGIMAVIVENAHSLKTLQFNRELEKEADMTGLDLLVKRGVNPNGMVNLFASLKKKSGKTIFPQFLSTHPMLEERMKYLKAEIAQRPTTFQANDSLQYYWQKLKE